MDQPDAITEHRRGLSKTLAIAALTGATVVALALPAMAQAEPEPTPPPPPPGNTFLQGPPPPPGAPAPPPRRPAPPADPNAPPPPPADPNAPPPPPADPNAPPPPPADPNAPPADPNAPAPPPPPEPGRVDNAAGGFSYVVPAGWKVSDATQLSYGQALLTKIPPSRQPGAQPAQPPNDTSVLLGRLDLKLFAGAETDNTKAAQRLASDMGEFFMPFPGTRINQETVPLDAAGMPGVASYYEVKFTDTNKPNGQIWAGVVGAPTARGHAARPAHTRAVVRGLARHRQQPGAQGRGRHARAVDPAVDAAASAAAGPQRTATTRGRHECARPEPQRRRAGSGRPEQRSSRNDAAGLSANRRLGFQGPTYGC